MCTENWSTLFHSCSVAGNQEGHNFVVKHPEIDLNKQDLYYLNLMCEDSEKNIFSSYVNVS
jgi:hypothetical protein